MSAANEGTAKPSHALNCSLEDRAFCVLEKTANDQAAEAELQPRKVTVRDSFWFCAVGEICAHSGIGECPILCDREGLQVRGAEIGQGVCGWGSDCMHPANATAKVEYCIRSETRA